MSDLAITGLLVLSLFLILGSGVWIGLTLSGVAWIGMQLFSSRPAGDAMAVTIWGSASSWTLTALPLFIWMGEILFRTRLSQDMFRGLAPWMQGLPGRLLHTNVAGCTIFAAVSGSSSQQELQINEYNQGRVLMTVTTNPETSTVFFRHDASLISRLDFSTEQGLAEGLRDAVDGAQQVIAVGLLADNGGLFVDVIAEEGVVERRIRQAALPMFSSRRKQPTTAALTFDPTLISAAAITQQTTSLRTLPQAEPDASVLFTIAVDPKLGVPVITFNAAGTTVITDLAGNDLTEQLK